VLTIGLAGGAALAALRLGLGVGRAGARVGSLAPLRWWPLAAVTVVLQIWLIFGAIDAVPTELRAAAIWGTQLAMVAVAIANLRRPWRAGMAVVLGGLSLNLIVMGANGGLMPVSPEALVRGRNGHVLQYLSAGDQLPHSKDVILRAEETTLLPLSDHFTTPLRRGSFSPGDVLIMVGTFFVLQSAVTAALDGRRT
jgi:hypothetical protein